MNTLQPENETRIFNQAPKPSIHFIAENQPVASVFFVVVSQIVLSVVLFLSLWFNIMELTIFCVILLAIGLSTYGWSRLSPLGVDCTIAAQKTRVFPDEPITLTISVANRKILPALIKIMFFIDRNLFERDIHEEIGLLWYQNASFTKTLMPRKRGVYPLGPAALHISDLFGFFPRNRRGTDHLEVIVYPKIIPTAPLSLPKRELFGIPGAQNPVEDPVYIIGVRDYQPSSPARRINWKASARHEKLQEKVCEPAEQEKILVCFDVSGFERHQACDLFESVLGQTASAILELETNKSAVGFATNARLTGNASPIIPISRTPHKTATILELMARMQMVSSAGLHDILSKGYALPWGVTTLLYGYEPTDHTALLAYFNVRKVPVHCMSAKSDQQTGRLMGSTQRPMVNPALYGDEV